MRKGLFSIVFGETPRNAVLEYFLEAREIDHAISDIAVDLAMNRATTYNIAESLLEEHILIPTRKVGNTQLYKLDEQQPIVQALIAAFDAILQKAPAIEATAEH